MILRWPRLGLHKWEKLLVAVLAAGLLLTFSLILRSFYLDHTLPLPKAGGSFTEGSVGDFPPNYLINPLFSTGLEEDISGLVFDSLLKYDPITGEITNQLAEHILSADKRTYEFTLKEGLSWHDGEPLTTDDVEYTYRYVIQHPEFPNKYLQNAFRDVEIERVDERVIRFTIPEKRKTFFTNLTVGILPKHILIDTSPADLLNDRFNQFPIGSGPYKFVDVRPLTNVTEIELETFDGYFRGSPKIERVIFKIYPTQADLVNELSTLDGVRPMQKVQAEELPGGERFQSKEFQLPAYVAMFFNMENETLTTKKIRQAMRASIDKNTLAEKYYGERVDTPFVELWPQNDIVNISIARAGELLNEAGYFFADEKAGEHLAPSVKKVAETSVEDEAIGDVSVAAKYLLEPKPKTVIDLNIKSTFLVGKVPAETRFVKVGEYLLQKFNPEKGTFSYKIDADIGTLEKGENKYLIRFFDRNFALIDREQVTVNYDPVKVIETPETPENQPIPVTDVIKEIAAGQLPWRFTNKNEFISLELTYLDGVEYLGNLAKDLQQGWSVIGVEIKLRALQQEAFAEAIVSKNYELILLPQHVGYNLDTYPYFHLSQAGNGYNVSNWKNLEASILLEEIRATHDTKKRHEKIRRLTDILIDDAPAIFLYSPTYTWLYTDKINNVAVENIATISNHLYKLEDSFVRKSRQFRGNANYFNFFGWFIGKTGEMFTGS